MKISQEKVINYYYDDNDNDDDDDDDVDDDQDDDKDDWNAAVKGKGWQCKSDQCSKNDHDILLTISMSVHNRN